MVLSHVAIQELHTLVPRLDGPARVDNFAWALVATRDRAIEQINDFRVLQQSPVLHYRNHRSRDYQSIGQVFFFSSSNHAT